MKIALVSFYCLDSTMPLAKHLADENVDVHLYGLMPQFNQNVFVIDFTNNRQPNGFIKSDILTQKMGKGLCNYLSVLTTKFFIFPAGSGKRYLFSDIYYAWRLSRHLIRRKFEVIHLIHTSGRFSLMVMYLLRNQHLIQTLHEVTAHTGDTDSDNLTTLKNLVKYEIPVIFHSLISKERFLAFRSSISSKPLNNDLYKMIRFSLYETYDFFSSNEKNEKEQTTNRTIPIVLHFGRIVPYKGIDILIDAVKIIQKTQKVHLIVAGGGDPYFNFDGVDSYEFINNTISNEEIINLIKKCTLVVCPYRSASQSGIPMTVFPFQKPIVASNMDGFKEVIEHNITGLIVDKMDAASFAHAIDKLIMNEDLRQKMANNIKNKFVKGEFSWENIAKETISFYLQ